MPNNLSQFLAGLDRAGNQVVEASATGVRAATAAIDVGVEAEVRSAAPGMRMRGVGISGAPLSVKADVRRQGTGSVGLVRMGANVGAAYLLEYGSPAHLVVPRRASALRTPYGPRLSARIPSTEAKAKRPFHKGRDAAIPAAVAAMTNAVAAGLARVV